MKLRTFALLMILAAGLTPRALGQAALTFTSVNSSFYLDGSNRMLGWQFSVTQQLDVLSLGWFDWAGNGLAASHQIGIWDVSNTATPIVSITVPSGTSAALNNNFRYVALGAPVTLQPGNTYRVAGFDPASSDAHVWDIVLGGYANVEVFSFNRDSRITLISSGGIGPFASGFEYPATLVGDGRSVLMGPNMLLSTVPEPATTTLLMMLSAAGAVAWNRRRRMGRV